MSSPVSFPIGSKDGLLRYTDRENYHFLEFTNAPDNRFTPDFCRAYIEALTYIQKEGEPKPLITTSAFPKFFSNGLNLELALATPNFFPDCYYAVMRVILEFPWPTIAWVNGHGFAAAFTCAACHDFIVMNPERGYLCMNEVEFGAPLPAPMMAILLHRYGTELAKRIFLTAERFGGKAALANGLITATGGLPEAEQIAEKVSKLAQSASYSQIRVGLYKHVIQSTLEYEDEQNYMTSEATRQHEYYDAIVKQYKARL